MGIIMSVLFQICYLIYELHVIVNNLLYKKLKSEKEVVLAAVKQNGNALEYASENLKADKEVVLAAVKQDASSIKYASNDLKEDEDIKAIVLGL